MVPPRKIQHHGTQRRRLRKQIHAKTSTDNNRKHRSKLRNTGEPQLPRRDTTTDDKNRRLPQRTRIHKIIAKIKVTYSCEIEYQTKIDCGFNALQIQGQAEQLSQTETNWHASAVPEEYFNFNRPRLLTMYGVGLSYNHNEKTLQVENNPQRLEPPRLPQVNIAESLSSQLAQYFDPDTTPATNNAQIETTIHDPTTSTPKKIPFRYKRKPQPPKPTPTGAKRLKTKSYGDSSILHWNTHISQLLQGKHRHWNNSSRHRPRRIHNNPSHKRPTKRKRPKQSQRPTRRSFRTLETQKHLRSKRLGVMKPKHELRKTARRPNKSSTDKTIHKHKTNHKEIRISANSTTRNTKQTRTSQRTIRFVIDTRKTTRKNPPTSKTIKIIQNIRNRLNRFLRAIFPHIL